MGAVTIPVDKTNRKEPLGGRGPKIQFSSIARKAHARTCAFTYTWMRAHTGTLSTPSGRTGYSCRTLDSTHLLSIAYSRVLWRRPRRLAAAGPSLVHTQVQVSIDLCTAYRSSHACSFSRDMCSMDNTPGTGTRAGFEDVPHTHVPPSQWIWSGMDARALLAVEAHAHQAVRVA